MRTAELSDHDDSIRGHVSMVEKDAVASIAHR